MEDVMGYDPEKDMDYCTQCCDDLDPHRETGETDNNFCPECRPSCPDCEGTGGTASNLCLTCEGLGLEATDG